SSIITVIAQKKGGAVNSTETFPLGIRIENALVSYAKYLGNMIWPEGLAVFYPHPNGRLPFWQPALAAIVLLGATVLAARFLKRYKYAATGWFWYLGTLVPVIGLVQVGLQSRADRYAYVPLIGIFLLLVWGAAEFALKGNFAGKFLAGVTVA